MVMAVLESIVEMWYPCKSVESVSSVVCRYRERDSSERIDHR